MSTQVDHLVVAARTLEEGRTWCERTLGVAPVVGGRHALMGTHNLLLNLSSPTHERCYLEIIAIDPQADPPSRPRWFGLDDWTSEEPGLVQVVVRSRTLDMHRWGLMHQGIDPGPLVSLSRGNLHWQMLLRDDARVVPPLPMFIQWTQGHPTDHLPASGVSLRSIALDGLAPRVERVLGLHRGAGDPQAPAAQRVEIEGPLGVARWATA